jgi:type II secretory pathway predicted ATPase ExeA
MGEAGAIVGGHIDRNDLREALYVETDEDELVTNFFADEYERDGRCLVITGSAGDGKSALLSRAFQEAQGTNSDIEGVQVTAKAHFFPELFKKHRVRTQTLNSHIFTWMQPPPKENIRRMRKLSRIFLTPSQRVLRLVVDHGQG